MLILNGKKFAANAREFTEALFIPGGTCQGYYRARKTGIDLLDLQQNKVGVITRRRVLAKATKQPNGRYWYSYGDVDLVGPYQSYQQQCREVELALEAHNITCL